MNLPGLQEETGNSNHSAAEKVKHFLEKDAKSETEFLIHIFFPQRALRFWLERGVAGFVICDTDAVYSVEVNMNCIQKS